MDWFWLLQVALDILFLGLFLYWAYYRWGKEESAVSSSRELELEALMKGIEKRAGISEKKNTESREKLDAQLKNLLRICEKANEAIDQLHLPTGFSNPSIEGDEIATLTKQSPQMLNETIPKLNEVEAEIKKDESDTQLDLRAVLQGQLA